MRRARHEVDPATRQHGFSLIEMLLVLTILALALTVSVFDYRRPTSSLEPRTLALRLAAELRLARHTAISRSRDVAFVFNARERWFQGDSLERVHVPEPTVVTLLTAQDFVLRDDDAWLIFFRDGSSSGGRITLTTGDNIQSIAIDWLTASVRLEGHVPHNDENM